MSGRNSAHCISLPLLRTVSALFFSLFAGLFADSCRAAQNFPYESCHIETQPAKPVDATLIFTAQTPDCTAREWAIFSPIPPLLPGQVDVSQTVTLKDSPVCGEQGHEFSLLNRPIIIARVPANNPQLKSQITVQCNYSARLIPRRLVTGKAPTVIPLAAAERELCLLSTDTIDHNSQSFLSYLDAHHLRKTSTESDLDFAWRLFQFIRENYTYRFEPALNRWATSVCQTNSTDCGGLSILFVAALRANGVPARVLFGRWCESSSNQKYAKLAFGACHVKSEFFVSDVGWVPVELSGAVTSKTTDPLLYFGRDSGKFLTIHVDTDLVYDTIWFGKKPIRYQQAPIYWVVGQGTMKGAADQVDWRVNSN